MINTMLVLLSGGSTDAAVCSAAAAIGRPLRAHLACYHPRLPAAEAALARPSSGFAMGSAVAEMLAEIDEDSERRSAAARDCFTHLCRHERIPVVNAPKTGMFSAGWLCRPVESADAVMRSARYRDVIVVGRSHSGYGLPSDFLEQLVIGCGRPVLIAPDRSACPAPETIMVWWKDGPYAARALAAAMPLLIQAKRVIVTAAREESSRLPDLSELVDELCLHGIAAETCILPEARGATAHRLMAAAEENMVNLVVLGAYGRGPTRELFFGGVTQAVLESADVPVLLAH